MVSHELFQWKYLNSLQEHRGKKINKRKKISRKTWNCCKLFPTTEIKLAGNKNTGSSN